MARVNRAELGPPHPDLQGEARKQLILFQDNMEGTDPGWTSVGSKNEWERGIPTVANGIQYEEM